MEKHADTADISVLFFPLAVLMIWLYTLKLAKDSSLGFPCIVCLFADFVFLFCELLSVVLAL